MPADLEQIIKVSADEVEQLRAGDLQRVFDEAADRGVGQEEFRIWLTEQDLMPRTRARLERFQHEV